jgi:hypothetical protein
MKVMLSGVGVIVGCVVVYKWFSHLSKKNDMAFRSEVLTDAAEWIASQTRHSPVQIAADLEQMINGEAVASTLKSLLRVECEVTKVDALRAKRVVVVALTNGENIRTGRIETEIRWESLPQEIRERFIKEQETTQCFVLFERREGSQDA